MNAICGYAVSLCNYVGDPKRLASHESISSIWHHFVDKVPTIPPPEWDPSFTAPQSLFIVMELFPLSLQVNRTFA
jgi:hypothetical protein